MQPEGVLKCVRNFSWKNLEEKDNFTELGLDGGKIRSVLNKRTVNV